MEWIDLSDLFIHVQRKPIISHPVIHKFYLRVSYPLPTVNILSLSSVALSPTLTGLYIVTGDTIVNFRHNVVYLADNKH